MKGSKNITVSKSVKGFTVFVGGIPGNISQIEVEKYFSSFGKVNDVIIPPKKENPVLNNGYCYVSFSSEEAKLTVLRIKDHFLGPRRVSCKNYLKGNSLSSEITASNERKLFVKFVPDWVSEPQFREYFEQFGTLESYYMVKYKDSKLPASPSTGSIGYLVYKDQNTCQNMASRRFFKIGNRKMQVERYSQQLTKGGSSQKCSKIPIEDVHSAKPTQKSYLNFNNRLNPSFDQGVQENLRFNYRSFRGRSQAFDCQNLSSFQTVSGSVLLIASKATLTEDTNSSGSLAHHCSLSTGSIERSRNGSLESPICKRGKTHSGSSYLLFPLK